MSSIRRLWKHLLSCGWQKSLGRDGGAEPTSKPTLSFAALPTSVVSQLNCCNMFSLAPALKTTQELRQMQNAAPDPRPRAGVSWSQVCRPLSLHSGNVERSESLHNNVLTLTVPLMHEVDTSITG